MLIHGACDNELWPPRFGGPQRTFGLYRGMARAHDVRVLCLVPNRNRGARDERAEGVAMARRKAWYTAAAWRLERSGLLPLVAAADAHGLRARALLGELPGRPDALVTEFTLSGLLGRAGARLDVYSSHNVESDFWPATAPPVALRGAWAARVREREARAVLGADLTVVACTEDADRMVALHGAERSRIEVVPNGYDETAVRPPTPAERERARGALGLGPGDYACVFLGSDVPHNRDAARLLVERVFPALAGTGVALVIAGSVGAALGAARAPWLRVLGEVDDVGAVLHAADAGLNPVLRGGGSNIKVPTYLAAGLAVVTTPFGGRGYAALAPWTVVAEPDAFAEVLRARPAGWRVRGAEMPAPVAAHAWGRLGEALAETIAARLDAAGSRRTVA